MPQFSVLLPTHNRADVVALAIQSVLAQTEPGFELLVVGDGCTDDTAAVVTGFRDPRIRWFDLPKAPFYGYANRNIALRAAAGSIVAYIAHDDLLFPDHLAVLGGALEETRADWIFSRPVWVSMQGVIVVYPLTLAHPDELQSFMSLGNPVPMSCVAHRRSCFDRFGFWPEDVPRGADWAYWKQVIAGGGVPASCRVPTTLHFVADWRRPIGVGQPEAQVLLGRATESWWPQSLTIPPRNGETEQAAVLREMQAGGPEWCRTVRRDLDTVIDRLAWEQVNEMRNRASARTLPQRILRRLGQRT
jgi:hypothetical protein